ncbi:MAG: ATP-dependent DNA helicase [archaeon]
MVSQDRKEELLFPHDLLREEQNKFLLLTAAAIENKGNLIMHAPTGLGKTAAALGPALKAAIDHDLTVLFLTSRHTQHKIAIDTLKDIKKKYGNSFGSVSIIGKKWMCLVEGVDKLYSRDFSDYCKKVREEKKCMFYTNARKNQSTFTPAGLNLIKTINTIGPMSTEQVIDESKRDNMCPYEISLGMAAKAKVIITDYYYLFHPSIGDNFLTRIGKDLDKLIVIVDEAHNLPYRLKDLASEYMTNIVIKRALQEAKKYGYDSAYDILQKINEVLLELVREMKIGDERKLAKLDFEAKLRIAYDYDEMIEDLNFIGDKIRELQKQSYVGSVAEFLAFWKGEDEGFVRILSFKQGSREPLITISYRCLDPSVVCSDIINNTYSTLLMSGTLLPTVMYKELLGIEKCQEVVFKDPFPKKNRLNLIIPRTTTKYSARSEAQFKQIAETLAEVVDAVPGHSAVFFPSYYVLDQVRKFFDMKTSKTVFTEAAGMSKDEKQSFLERFKGYKDIGATLLGVASGSFGEGIDLPGDLLKAVIVVGLPLSAPDLETKSLIEYFDKKFKKGWDYGYLFPAFNKTLQNAGRCIRSETDKGVIVFLDERFVWPNYKRCFPEDWDMVVSSDPIKLIKDFFG